MWILDEVENYVLVWHLGCCNGILVISSMCVSSHIIAFIQSGWILARKHFRLLLFFQDCLTVIGANGFIIYLIMCCCINLTQTYRNYYQYLLFQLLVPHALCTTIDAEVHTGSALHMCFSVHTSMWTACIHISCSLTANHVDWLAGVESQWWWWVRYTVEGSTSNTKKLAD